MFHQFFNSTVFMTKRCTESLLVQQNLSYATEMADGALSRGLTFSGAACLFPVDLLVMSNLLDIMSGLAACAISWLHVCVVVR